MTDAKSLMKEFERMRFTAEAKALSKISLERPLSEHEYKRFVEVCKQIGVKQ